MSPKRVLVTGGAGYIGSHAAKALRAEGYEPVVLDDLSTGHREAALFGPFVEGKIEDVALVDDTVKRFSIEGVLHFAASAYVRESLLLPAKYFRNNIANSVALLEAVTRAGVNKIIFSSSCAVYGNASGAPITESAPTNPINPYGESKLAIERVLSWYARLGIAASIALRYFNAAGADPEGELGETHDPETHLIPSALKAAMSDAGVVDIFGVDFGTHDGTAVRDYIHVADIADAHVRAYKVLERAPVDARCFNLGTGRGYSVREILRAVENVSGRQVRTREAPRNPGDPPSLVADPSCGQRVLEWRASRSTLEEILDTAYRWESKSRARDEARQ